MVLGGWGATHITKARYYLKYILPFLFDYDTRFNFVLTTGIRVYLHKPLKNFSCKRIPCYIFIENDDVNSKVMKNINVRNAMCISEWPRQCMFNKNKNNKFSYISIFTFVNNDLTWLRLDFSEFDSNSILKQMHACSAHVSGACVRDQFRSGGGGGGGVEVSCPNIL